MKLNKNLIKTLALACAITIPGATYAKTLTLPEFIISCLLPNGSVIQPDLEIPEITPPTNKPDVNVPNIGGANLAYENQVVTLVNKERTSRGLQPLQMDVEAQKVARIKSQDMRKNNYFDHVSPTYGTPFEMLQSFGVSYTMAGENIAAGYTSPEAVVKGWMNSPGHRENILNPNYTHIGVGYESNGHYWTQMFIR